MKEKLIIGIDETTDIQQLLNDGIRQFYFGYIPPSYSDTYATQTSPNRRYRAKEQFGDLARAYETIETIHEKDGIVYLALNAFGSNETMRNYSQEITTLFASVVDGIIVANVTIASMLKEQGYEKLILSNLFGVYSTQAVAFLQQQFDPIKIILPRDIPLQSIEEIVTAYPRQQFECFLYGDNCRYSESFCFSEHGYDSVGFGSLCSFAHANKRLIEAPNPAYKQIVKSPKLSTEQKQAYLQTKHLDIATLLDEIALYHHQGNSQEAAKRLEIMARFDAEHFLQSQRLYAHTLLLLKSLIYPKATEILHKLETTKQSAKEESYKRFHKLNSSAIRQTLAFFERFDNIVSYKIPSRGRELYRYIEQIAHDTQPYNYKESQYKL